MSIEELQVRGWLREWKNYKPNDKQFKTVNIVAVPGRSGVTDFDFKHYPSIAYEARDKITGKCDAHTEGRDALLRLFAVVRTVIEPS